MHRLVVRFGSIGVFCGLCLVALGGVTAQETGVTLPKDTGVEDLKNKVDAKDFRTTFGDLVNAKEQPTKKHDELIDTAAQWFVYRVTWDKGLLRTKMGQLTIRNVLDEFDRRMGDIIRTGEKADNNKFAAKFAARLMHHLKEVFKQGPIQSRIYAGVMMQRLAQTGRQELIPAMTEILSSKEPSYPPYVQIYALKGLKELFERQPTGAAERKQRAGDYKAAVAALIELVETTPKMPKQADTAEQQRIRDVKRYFRREAIRALAQVRMPAMAVDGASKKVEGPVAHVLMRVLTGEDMNPSPWLSEKVEAAVGLCSMRPEPGSLYQSDLALFLVTQFIVKEFSPAYNKDFDRFQDIEVYPKPKPVPRGQRGPIKKESRIIRAEPWKIHRERLMHALTLLEAAVPDAAAKKKVNNVYKHVNILLGPVLTVRLQIKQEEIDGLEKMVPTLKPASGVVYRGIDEYKIKVGGTDGE
jgi:hypothetical protein